MRASPQRPDEGEHLGRFRRAVAVAFAYFNRTLTPTSKSGPIGPPCVLTIMMELAGGQKKIIIFAASNYYGKNAFLFLPDEAANVSM
jgi:hypothetical protein